MLAFELRANCGKSVRRCSPRDSVRTFADVYIRRPATSSEAASRVRSRSRAVSFAFSRAIQPKLGIRSVQSLSNAASEAVRPSPLRQ